MLKMYPEYEKSPLGRYADEHAPTASCEVDRPSPKPSLGKIVARYMALMSVVYGMLALLWCFYHG